MATVVAGAEDRSVSIGRILSRAFGTIGHNPAATLGIAFLFSGLPSTLLNILMQSIRADVVAELGLWTTFALGVVSFVIAIFFAMVTQGALVRATIAESEGRVASVGESIMAGLVVVVPLFLLALLLAVCVGIGFLFFFVPGVMLYMMWSVAAPTLVEERRGVFGALARSRELTKGARWKIFGLTLIILAIWWIASGILGVFFVTFYGTGLAAAVTAQQGMPVPIILISAAVSTAMSAIWCLAQTSLFVELRNWKDGPAAETLADVFA